ncbi:glycosyltransferase family 4 protein [Chryseobacterium pennipullorum]|uniref:Glycosyltransferase family 4 protein n=1 Tax=Chryseobacterium pennipullorum TaxID=2258963 RepID=A0A3D9B8C2_9FLAO|nr:glycosyltransferase family 4 protein [Chryseobacterium pennipullorum]REC49607.1 hypothetical protein DRF67_03835 [Chryseobacterium pennipullorum]
MNVVFFIPSLKNKGGVERATISLLNSIVDYENVNVFLVVLNKNEQTDSFEISPKVKMMSLDIKNYKTQYFTLIKNLKNFIKIKEIDVFVSVESMSLLFSYLPIFSLKKRPKFVVWEHFNFKNNNGKKLRDYFRKIAARKAELIVTLTERDVAMWNQNLKPKSHVTYIYNISPFQDHIARYDETSRTAITIGRYVPVKGFDRLIKAWSIFDKKYNVQDWKLNIVGYGEEKEKLQQQIESENCKSIFLIDGSKSVADQYQQASFYCMSSYFEGLPMVLIEAQNFGLPSIAFDIYSGPSEILGCGSGILIEDANLESYADGIYDLVTKEELRIKMSGIAIQNKSRFDGKTIAENWIKNFQKLL